MAFIELIVTNDLGFHARAAARFVQEAAKFNSEVWLTKSSNRVNGKSIMGILTLAAAKGEHIILEVEGPDEEAALGVLSELIKNGFGEERNEIKKEDGE
jgi:phosphocarrier protein